MTQKELKKLIHYDPHTGLITRLSTNVHCGIVHTSKQRSNYKRIVVNLSSKQYLAHRLAWLYMTGEWPEEIDHIDKDPTNNVWSNLRNVSHGENQKNRSIQVNNKTGIPGVRKMPHNDKFRAEIQVNGKGLFLTEKHDFFEVCCARKSAELTHNFGVQTF